MVNGQKFKMNSSPRRLPKPSVPAITSKGGEEPGKTPGPTDLHPGLAAFPVGRGIKRGGECAGRRGLQAPDGGLKDQAILGAAALRAGVTMGGSAPSVLASPHGSETPGELNGLHPRPKRCHNRKDQVILGARTAEIENLEHQPRATVPVGRCEGAVERDGRAQWSRPPHPDDLTQERIRLIADLRKLGWPRWTKGARDGERRRSAA